MCVHNTRIVASWEVFVYNIHVSWLGAGVLYHIDYCIPAIPVTGTVTQKSAEATTSHPWARMWDRFLHVLYGLARDHPNDTTVCELGCFDGASCNGRLYDCLFSRSDDTVVLDRFQCLSHQTFIGQFTGPACTLGPENILMRHASTSFTNTGARILRCALSAQAWVTEKIMVVQDERNEQDFEFLYGQAVATFLEQCNGADARRTRASKTNNCQQKRTAA